MSDGGADDLTENPGVLRRGEGVGVGSLVCKCQDYSDFEDLDLCHADVTESYHEQIKCTEHLYINM